MEMAFDEENESGDRERTEFDCNALRRDADDDCAGSDRSSGENGFSRQVI
jgi:hypothetical protein